MLVAAICETFLNKVGYRSATASPFSKIQTNVLSLAE